MRGSFILGLACAATPDVLLLPPLARALLRNERGSHTRRVLLGAALPSEWLQNDPTPPGTRLLIPIAE